jgi:hypothetical protein
MSFYTNNLNNQGQNLLPPTRRKSGWLAWLAVLMKPLQWLWDNLFTSYREGDYSTADFNPATTYAVGDRVKYSKGIYEMIALAVAGTTPLNTTAWTKVQDNFIGVIDRAKFSAEDLKFEYALNLWFDTTFRQPPLTSDIYINDLNSNLVDFFVGYQENESSEIVAINGEAISFIQSANPTYGAADFSINIPLAIFNALGASNPEREAVVRRFADQINTAGLTYTINTY